MTVSLGDKKANELTNSYLGPLQRHVANVL